MASASYSSNAAAFSPRLGRSGSLGCVLASPYAHRLSPPAFPARERQGFVRSSTARDATSPPDISLEIENLDTNYCDDFVCSSSPAVEASIRAMGRDIARANGVWTRSILSRKVEYEDAFRRFKGPEGYARLDFVPKCVQRPRISIKKIKMIDTSTAEIAWELIGQVGPFHVDVDMSTCITMNLLTGQIEKHQESWNLMKCSPLGALSWNLSRMLWSARSGGADAAQATGSVLGSLTSVDDEDDGYGTMPNPNDPMKFFQQRDSFKESTILRQRDVS